MRVVLGQQLFGPQYGCKFRESLHGCPWDSSPSRQISDSQHQNCFSKWCSVLHSYQAGKMLGVRGGRSSETLGSSFKLHFQFFPGWRDREILQSCSAWKWGWGAAGTSAGVGLQKSMRNAECSTSFSPSLCAGEQKGPVSPGRRKRHFFMPVSHERRCDTGDLAEGDGRGWRQHSNLQCDEWPKDSQGLCQPRELCPQRVTSLGHLLSWSHPPRWRMLQMHLQHISLGGCHRQDVSQGLW